MMKHIIALSLLHFATISVPGQIPTVFLPDSLAINEIVFPGNINANTFQIPAVDVNRYIAEDRELDAGNSPFRFGAPISTSIDFIKEATQTISAGNIGWKLNLTSKNAVSLNIVLEKISLACNGQLYFYNKRGTIIQGPITYSLLGNVDRLSSSVLPGDTISVEYFQPLTSSEMPVINISKVVYGYRSFSGLDGDYGTSESCNIDINCPQGQSWCVQARAINRILINDNAWCTGATVNTLQQNLRGYVLTANHCLTNDLSAWQFEFHYKDPYCNAPLYSGLTWTFLGSVLRANWIGTDFALLEMNNYNASNNIHRLANIHLAGWSRNAASPPNSTAIHHPSGDVMKISIENDPATSTFFNNNTPANSHWQVHFEAGTVEHASSGSPLFDQNKRIVGQLHGNLNYNSGASYCSIPDGWYGKFDRSWAGNGTSASRLSDWLDPLGSIAMVSDAISPTVIHHNQLINYNQGLRAATHTMELAGNIIGYPAIPFSWSPYPINGQAFTVFSNGASVYKAGESIQILPGVSVQPGGNFHAYISPFSCN